MAVSSAKRAIESEGKTLGRSLMKAKKREGPRTDPCGTPEVGNPRVEKEALTRVT